MCQHISATARCAYTPRFPLQLIYSGYNSWLSYHLEKLLSFELLDLQRLALDCVGYAMMTQSSYAMMTQSGYAMMTPNKADAAVHGWLSDTVIPMCSVIVTPWYGFTCVLLDFGLFSTSNRRKCRHKNNSLTCSLRADRFWLRLFGSVYVWVGWKNVGCQSSIL